MQEDPRLSLQCTTTVVTPQGHQQARESVLRESPVDILLNDEPAGTALVLASELEEFAVGYLFGRGYINPGETVYGAEICDRGRVIVYAEAEPGREEKMVTTSGCGGTGQMAQRLYAESYPEPSEFVLTFSQVEELIRRTLSCSPLREETHCVHGCGYLNEQGFQACFEDVGRHNAVDKLLGGILLGRYSLPGAVYTTGRLTSDMVLKCARLGIPVVLSRTAPSSLGVEIARESGLTLAGYARPNRVNVFHAPHRIQEDYVGVSKG